MSETDYSKIKTTIAACVKLLKERNQQLKQRDDTPDKLTKRINALKIQFQSRTGLKNSSAKRRVSTNAIDENIKPQLISSHLYLRN